MHIALLAWGEATGTHNAQPYAKQLQNLIPLFARRHNVSWIAIAAAHHTHPLAQHPNLSHAIPLAHSARLPIYVSTINQACHRHQIDALLSLFDLNRIFVDAPFAPHALHWFPNHFASLDIHSAHALPAYDVVVSLAPSDAAGVARQLPLSRVVHVPHAIEPTASGLPRARLRAQFGMPADAFVVLLHFVNYDALNRKSVDVSAQAFRALLATHPRAFLYVHATTLEASRGSVSALPVAHLLEAAALPRGRYVVDTRELAYETVWELLEAADVLCHPAKVEGFGLPVLEAQALGTPVVTTRIGAMADYTFYGFSVPPLQMEWLELGYVATPNVSGFAEALARVADGLLPRSDAEAARERIARDFSTAAVAKGLLAELRRPKPKPAVDYATLRYGERGSASDAAMEGAAEWTVVADHTHALLPASIGAILANHSARDEMVVLQTRENDNALTPSSEELGELDLPSRPVVALPSAQLRRLVLEEDEDEPAVLERLLAAAFLEPSRVLGVSISLGGVGAVRVPEGYPQITPLYRRTSTV